MKDPTKELLEDIGYLISGLVVVLLLSGSAMWVSYILGLCVSAFKNGTGGF